MSKEVMISFAIGAALSGGFNAAFSRASEDG